MLTSNKKVPIIIKKKTPAPPNFFWGKCIARKYCCSFNHRNTCCLLSKKYSEMVVLVNYTEQVTRGQFHELAPE